MGVTQEDIAKELGIHRSTVSKVLNNHGTALVSEDTRRKILDTARGLGYSFSRLRRPYRRGNTRWSLDIPVLLEILDDQATVQERGEARLVNISKDGGLSRGLSR